MGNTCSLCGPPRNGVTRSLVLTQDYKLSKQPLNCKVDGERFVSLAQKCGVRDNKLDHDGTVEGAEEQLRKFSKRCRSGDTFVLFFAGHGMSVKDEDGDEEDGMDEALCFASGSEFKTLTDDELSVLLDDFDDGVNILLIMDSCHSGTVGDLEKPCWAGRRAVCISACQDYQESVDTGSGGMLTGLILETLEELVAESPLETLSVQDLVDAMEASAHYVDFSESQQINATHTSSCSPASFQWPLVPEVGFSVSIFDDECGKGLLDATQFTTRAASSAPEDFAEAMVYYHNIAREAHGAPPVEWDDDIAAHAKLAADQCASEGFSHCHCYEYEENQNGAMHTAYESMEPRVAVHHAVRFWYNEVNEPGYSDGMDLNYATAHFTQVVWKGTEKIGAAMSGQYIMCNYGPMGNQTGAFGDNVEAAVQGDVEEVLDETDIKEGGG